MYYLKMLILSFLFLSFFLQLLPEGKLHKFTENTIWLLFFCSLLAAICKVILNKADIADADLFTINSDFSLPDTKNEYGQRELESLINEEYDSYIKDVLEDKEIDAANMNDGSNDNESLNINSHKNVSDKIEVEIPKIHSNGEEITIPPIDIP